MGNWTWEQAEQMTGGTSSFFTLQDGGVARVRFLYNTVEDIVPIVAHSINENGNYALIECAIVSNDTPLDACKYCLAGNKAVLRVVIPIFNEDTQTIQYWTRSGSWVKKTLIPLLQEVPGPISGQVFKLKRQGQQLDTNYTLIPDTTVAHDGRTKEHFGEIQNPVESGCVKEANYTFPVNNNQQGFGNNQNFNNQGFNNQNNGFQNNQGFGNNNGGFQSTRRTSAF